MSEEYLKPYQSSMTERLEEIKQLVLDGDINPLNALEAHKRMSDYLSEFKSAIEDLAKDEYYKHGEKKVSFGGAEFSISQGGRYDYSNDEEWRALNNAKKEREKLLQTAYKTEGDLVVDGELIEKPKYNHNKESVTVKLKNK